MRHAAHRHRDTVSQRQSCLPTSATHWGLFLGRPLWNLSPAGGPDRKPAGGTRPRSDSGPVKTQPELGPLHYFGFEGLHWSKGVCKGQQTPQESPGFQEKWGSQCQLITASPRSTRQTLSPRSTKQLLSLLFGAWRAREKASGLRSRAALCSNSTANPNLVFGATFPHRGANRSCSSWGRGPQAHGDGTLPGGAWASRAHGAPQAMCLPISPEAPHMARPGLCFPPSLPSRGSPGTGTVPPTCQTPSRTGASECCDGSFSPPCVQPPSRGQGHPPL